MTRFHAVLWQPEIPPNTGNLMRLTVNTGSALHLIGPLGFELDDARMRRAGLDYKEFADVMMHDSYEGFVRTVQPQRVFAFTQHATTLYTDVSYALGDALLFGRESDGLAPEVLDHPSIAEQVRIPIAAGGRSLNLANAAAIGVYEAWRQHDFADGAAGSVTP